MIKYQLKCKKCNNTFDSWFASSKEFEKLKKIKLINCNFCKSLKVEKSIMSPRVAKKLIVNSELRNLKNNEVKNKIKNFKVILKKILNMWVIIFLTRPGLFITVTKKINQFMVKLHLRKLKI